IYKVNYDEKNWLLLSKALKSDFTKIPTLNRVQLLADAADLGYVGHQKYDVFFDMLGYLKEETEYLPWKAALGKADALKNYLIRNPIYGVFKNYMTSLLSPIYEKLGGLAMANEENFDKLDKIKFQVLIVSRSCRYGVEKCIEDAKTMFNKWKSAPNDTNPVPKDLRSAVYCTALKNGGENEWNFLWNKYQQSNVATERNSLLNVLGCTREIWLLSRYLEWSLDDTKIRRQDTSTVFGAVAGNDVGYYIAKKFFFDNVNKIFKHLAPNKRRITRYLTSITSHMQDVDELHELSYLIDHNKENFSEVKQGVEQALETVKINIQWQQMHGKSIHDVLQKFSKI
uniref:ERAP1-like C-terminal domain-containing protein n=4 Tax=Dendroctonus ponderosae TaxID=77166 RepID=A0AAR5P193_DENPD